MAAVAGQSRRMDPRRMVATAAVIVLLPFGLLVAAFLPLTQWEDYVEDLLR